MARKPAISLGFGARSLLGPRTGIARYARNLATALAETGQVVPSYFYGLWWSERLLVESADQENVAADRRRRWVGAVPARVRRSGLLAPVRAYVETTSFRRGFDRKSLDLYHEPNYLPPGWQAPTVINVHDLSIVRYPELHPKERLRLFGSRLPDAVEKAETIITSSAYTRDEIVETFGVPIEKVAVVPHGVEPVFRLRDAEELDGVLRPLGLSPGGYILTVGTLEPRKNMERLIAAYARLPARLREGLPLVIVGATGWHDEGLRKALSDLPDHVDARLIGFLGDDDLAAAYAGAMIFAFPSLYEGFGLPVAEAMASGAPVISSDSSAMPEVVGDAGLLVPPKDVDAWTSALRRLIEVPDERERLSKAGHRRSRGFTWQESARQTLEVYRRVLG